MLTLYYSPGACSMASHIGLEESGAEYESVSTILAKGEHRTPDYLAINPRGKVPALRTETGVLTENTAILTYLARRFPQKRLLPSDLEAEMRCISMMVWLSTTVHPCYTHYFRPERFTTDPDGHDAVKEQGLASFWKNLQEIDGLLAGKTWMMGAEFTVVDPYALVFFAWGSNVQMPMAELRNYSAWKERMLARPAVRKVLEREQSRLVQVG